MLLQGLANEPRVPDKASETRPRESYIHIKPFKETTNLFLYSM